MAEPKQPRPRWRSLKAGDVVLHDGGWAAVMVKDRRRKQRWGKKGHVASYVVYWRDGLFLNLNTGELAWEQLGEQGVRGEVIRTEKQEKKGDPQLPDGASRREGA